MMYEKKTNKISKYYLYIINNIINNNNTSTKMKLTNEINNKKWKRNYTKEICIKLSNLIYIIKIRECIIDQLNIKNIKQNNIMLLLGSKLISLYNLCFYCSTTVSETIVFLFIQYILSEFPCNIIQKCFEIDYICHNVHINMKKFNEDIINEFNKEFFKKINITAYEEKLLKKDLANHNIENNQKKYNIIK